MGIVVKVVAIVMAVVIAVGILGTIIGVGVNLVHYMVNQGFNFQNAFSWSWNSYVEWVQKINPFKETAEQMTYDFVNKNVDVVACINL